MRAQIALDKSHKHNVQCSRAKTAYFFFGRRHVVSLTSRVSKAKVSQIVPAHTTVALLKHLLLKSTKARSTDSALLSAKKAGTDAAVTQCLALQNSFDNRQMCRDSMHVLQPLNVGRRRCSSGPWERRGRPRQSVVG